MNPALQRYTFNDASQQQQTKTDALLSQPKTDAAPPPAQNQEPSWQDFLNHIGGRAGIIAGGAEGARQAADYAARRSTATEYYGPDLGLTIYPKDQPGPNGAKAAFTQRGADGKETVLPVHVEPRDDVYRYHMQPLKDAVRFDPAELSRAYDLNKLSDGDRARLGLQPAAAEDKTAAGQNGQGFAVETRNQDEADLVASLRAQGKNANEIQTALDNLRAGKTSEAGSTNGPTPKESENYSWLFKSVENEVPDLKNPEVLGYLRGHTLFVNKDKKLVTGNDEIGGAVFGVPYVGDKLPANGIAPTYPDALKNFGPQYYIHSIARKADPALAGFGQVVMNKAIDTAKNAGFKVMSLEVFEDNIGARKLYEKSGFQYKQELIEPETGRRYYYMIKNLNND